MSAPQSGKPSWVCYVFVFSQCEKTDKVNGVAVKAPENSKVATASFCPECFERTPKNLTALGPVLEFFDDKVESIKRYDKFSDYIQEFGFGFIVDVV